VGSSPFEKREREEEYAIYEQKSQKRKGEKVNERRRRDYLEEKMNGGMISQENNGQKEGTKKGARPFNKKPPVSMFGKGREQSHWEKGSNPPGRKIGKKKGNRVNPLMVRQG